MTRFATPILLTSLLALGCNHALGAPSPVAERKAATPEALKAEIEALRDAKVAWRKVEWRTCLLDALKESAREKKPVFLWVLGGAPADGRC